MISSSERKEDGCPGERVKDTLLSEVHLSQKREQPEHGAREDKQTQRAEKGSLQKVSLSRKYFCFLKAVTGSVRRRIVSLSTWRWAKNESGKSRQRVGDWASFHLPVVKDVCVHNFYLQGQCQHKDVQGHTEVPQVNGVQALAAFQAAQNFP